MSAVAAPRWSIPPEHASRDPFTLSNVARIRLYASRAHDASTVPMKYLDRHSASGAAVRDSIVVRAQPFQDFYNRERPRR